jgi:hypothetical protein
LYGTERWDRIGVVSNGYIVVGGGTLEDIEFANTNFPNVLRPNNVLAPCWTDLNPAAGGALRIAVLTNGISDWTVVEWTNVPNFTDGELNTCQVWIGAEANDFGEDISFTYGLTISNGDGASLTVGAENKFGNRGQAVYFNGLGTAPTPVTQAPLYEVRVSSSPGAPGETHTVTFTAKGVETGQWRNCAEMDSAFTFGTTIACVEGEVTRR